MKGEGDCKPCLNSNSEPTAGRAGSSASGTSPEPGAACASCAEVAAAAWPSAASSMIVIRLAGDCVFPLREKWRGPTMSLQRLLLS